MIIIIYLRESKQTTFGDSLQIMIVIKLRNVGGLWRNDNGGGVVIGFKLRTILLIDQESG